MQRGEKPSQEIRFTGHGWEVIYDSVGRTLRDQDRARQGLEGRGLLRSFAAKIRGRAECKSWSATKRSSAQRWPPSVSRPTAVISSSSHWNAPDRHKRRPHEGGALPRAGPRRPLREPAGFQRLAPARLHLHQHVPLHAGGARRRPGGRSRRTGGTAEPARSDGVAGRGPPGARSLLPESMLRSGATSSPQAAFTRIEIQPPGWTVEIQTEVRLCGRTF
jgi:hypothetical protein